MSVACNEMCCHLQYYYDLNSYFYFSFVFGLLIDSHWDENGVCSLPNTTNRFLGCVLGAVINQCDRCATLPIFSYRFENVDRFLN